MALTKIVLSGGSGGEDGGSIYTAPNGVIVTSSAPTFVGNNSYKIENLFNNTIPTNNQEATGMFWMTSSNGNQILTFDFTSIYSSISSYGGIKKIVVYPVTLPGVVSSDYRILASDDGVSYSQVVGWTNNDFSTYSVENDHEVTINKKYIMFELTQNLQYGVALSEIEFYIEDAASHYYVSCQGGNDAYDGRTPMTAWATITKATQFTTVSNSVNTYIHIGPGTYREKITLTIQGYDSNRCIIFAGDPDCQYFVHDKPGIVRVTGCDVNDLDTTGTVFNFNNQKFVQLWDLWIDGTSNTYAITGNNSSATYGQTCVRVHVNAPQGFINTCNYDCVAISGNTGYYNCVNYNCVAYGGSGYGESTGFYGSWGFSNCYSVNCLSVGCSYIVGTAYNCVAYCANQGFIGYIVQPWAENPRYYLLYCYNCLAVCCTIDAVEFVVGVVYSQGAHSHGSNNSSFSCKTTYWPVGTIGSFRVTIRNIYNKSIKDVGTTSGISLPATDMIGFPRIIGIVDIGPIELTDYTYDWNDYVGTPPSIKITSQGSYIFKFPVRAGEQVIKSITLKTSNTDPNLKPKIILRGLGYEVSRTATFSIPDGTWETIAIALIPERSGVMEMVLQTQDPSTSAYTIFSDPS